MNSGYNSDPMMDALDFISTEGHEVRTCSRHAKILRRAGKPFELAIPENIGGWLNWRQRPTASHMVLAALLAANGGTADFGGLVYPDGRLDQGFLDEMSKVWHWLEVREPWFVAQKAGLRSASYFPVNVLPHGIRRLWGSTQQSSIITSHTIW